MLSREEEIDYFVGIFIFNPLDDPYHLERIETCIDSTIKAAKKFKKTVRLALCLNKSKVQGEEIIGIGPETLKMIDQKIEKFNLEKLDYTAINSCAKGYNYILKHGYNNTKAKKIVILADDYIMPYFWFYLIDKNFEKYQDASFMMPCTSFVSQQNLKIDIEYHKDWDVRVAEKGYQNATQYKTIFGGVKQQHIDEIAMKCLNNTVVPFSSPPSFETTVFKRELVKKVGFIEEGYSQIFYDNDYFNKIKNNNLKGYIAKNCFIFHYGKGGTKSFHKETADEKYINSPVENLLLKDIEIWNERTGQNVKPWWGEKK
jgi:hypothetical protein